MAEAPTLEQLGISSDVQKILEANAKDAITEPTQRWSKESSMVRLGKKLLPERVTVYRRLTGRAAALSTATIGQSLAKRAPDGGPVFVRTQEECSVQIPAFIDKVCEVCRETSGRPKQFYKESNYRGHMRGFHELEWEEIQRQEERDERRADREQRREELEILRSTIISGKAVTDEYKCAECGKTAKSAFGLQSHQRTHLSAVSQ